MSLDTCADIVRKGDPDRFAGAMLAPMPARGHLMVLYAFNVEVARAPWVTAEPMIAQMRLQWWRDVIAEIYGGGPVRRHEVATPLAEVIAQMGLPRGLFDGIIDAREADIERDPKTPEQAMTLADGTAGNLMVLAVKALGVGGEARHAARYLGRAQGAANLGMALPVLYKSGWRFLDGWEGASMGTGSPTNALIGAAAALGSEGLRQIELARENSASLPWAARPALLTGVRTYKVLRAMDHWKDRHRIFERDFGISEARRRVLALSKYWMRALY